jgi:hypothetical protein
MTGQFLITVRNREDFEVELLVTFEAYREIISVGDRPGGEAFWIPETVKVQAWVNGSPYDYSKKELSDWDDLIIEAMSEEISA